MDSEFQSCNSVRPCNTVTGTIPTIPRSTGVSARVRTPAVRELRTSGGALVDMAVLSADCRLGSRRGCRRRTHFCVDGPQAPTGFDESRHTHWHRTHHIAIDHLVEFDGVVVRVFEIDLSAPHAVAVVGRLPKSRTVKPRIRTLLTSLRSAKLRALSRQCYVPEVAAYLCGGDVYFFKPIRRSRLSDRGSERSGASPRP